MTQSPTPLRILYLDHAPIWGGAEAVLLNFICQLDPAHYAPLIATPQDGPLWTQAAAHHIPTAHLEIRPLNRAGLHFPTHLATAVAHIRRLIHQHHIHLLHSNTVRAHIPAALAAPLTRTPLIWSLHDNTFPPKLLRLLAPMPRHAITVSGWLAETYAPLGLAAKISVIHNGLTLPNLPPPPDTLRHELGIPPEAPIILNVGRLIPGKAPHLFIAAANQVGQQHPNAHFLLVGGPDSQTPTADTAAYLAELQQAIASSPLGPRLHALGHRTDIARFYQIADICVYTAVQPEGLPTVLLEAMSYAKPVVATAVGGAPEIITHNQTGLLVPHPPTASAIAAQIDRLLQNPTHAQTLGHAARQNLATEFSPTHQLNQTTHLYQTILNQR
jgi:glycosyltransferase involved in cell wall biosynthesis